MARFGDLDTQYFDASGDPLVNGKIYFYESGTTTPKITYADVNNAIPNSNPVLLDASGRQPNIFFEGVAKATLTNNSDVQIVSRDPVGETATNFGDEWVSTRIYGANDVVIGSDGQYYRSFLAGNQNNNPVTTSGYWVFLYSIEWNAGVTYQEGASVTYNDILYTSLQGSNLNNNPASTPLYWQYVGANWLSIVTYSDGQVVIGSDGSLYTSLQAANLNKDPTDPANSAWWIKSGDLRGIPSVGAEKTTSYTLQLSDAGFYVTVGTGGSIEIPDGIFSAGDIVNVFNNTSSVITITNTITTAYVAGVDADRATVDLATRGLMSVLFISGTVCVLTGSIS